MPPTPTTRAPSVLGMCGRVSAPRTALPRVYYPLVCSLGLSAPPCRVVRRTTTPRVSPQSTSTRPRPYVRAVGARVDHTAPTLHPRTRGVHAERLRSHTSDPCIPARPPHGGQWSHADTTRRPRHDDARGARRAVLGWPHGPLRPPTVPRTPPRRCFRLPAGIDQIHCLSPLSNIPAARARGSGAVVPSERPWATQRPRSGGVRAPWTVEGRADCSSAPAGSCLSAMGGGAAPGASAACAARARLGQTASTTRDGPARLPSTAPYRPADASRSVPIAGGKAQLALRSGAQQGTLPASGRARRARCARRDRPGASLGSSVPPRRAWPTRRAPSRSQAVRSSCPCCAPGVRARCRLRAGPVARVEHAEGARGRSGAETRPCVSPRGRVADLQACARTGLRNPNPTPHLTPNPNPTPSLNPNQVGGKLLRGFTSQSEEHVCTHRSA
jgi:hypothetical protein